MNAGNPKSSAPAKLFTPVRIGELELSNRIVMAPMTRSRALPRNIPNPLAAVYYSQRATAGLIVSEGTQVSEQGVGYPFTPGMITDEQVAGWKVITDAVHAKNGLIFAQLWHVGRVSIPELQPNGGLPVGPSAIAPEGQAYTANGAVDYGIPRALETSEIAGIVTDFQNAARRAKAAGFDGIELHGANGYLIDQFLRDGANHRTDQYGGSIENRVRFLLELVAAVTKVYRPGRVGVRLSLTSNVSGLKDSDPIALATYIAKKLSSLGIAYIHNNEFPQPASADIPLLAPVYRKHFNGALILCSGYTAETAEAAVVSKHADAVAFATLYISNPDLPHRLATGAPLVLPDRATYYGGTEVGYTDYPVFQQ